MVKLLFLIKEGYFLKLLWSFNLNIVRWFWCFIVNVTIKLIDYMKDHDISTFDQKLLIRIYKALHDNSGNSLKELFVRRESTINMCSKPELVVTSVNSALKGKNSLRYFGSVICNSLPIEIREDHSIFWFVTKIKQWNPIASPCTICKSYTGKVHFIKFIDY